ncbi:hypothetical protein CI610_01718 [invertebrate metagenome]|uniref:Serine dehydratase-like alpha subunit domain-containing protein n=1 Tax=invertebrate metagenome TaxID=1711999 RepID=A0A2H9T7T9_9ZZZZ
MQSAMLFAGFIEILKKEVVPATGCTEPVSVALAAAQCRQLLGKLPDSLNVRVSPNLLKNGLGVTVPPTGKKGLPIAAAVGAVGGNAEAGLQVLADITPEQVSQAEQMISDGKIIIQQAPVSNTVYVRATAKAGTDEAVVTIADKHTHIIERSLNGTHYLTEPENDKNSPTPSAPFDISQSSAREIYDFSLTAPLNSIEFMGFTATLNASLAQEGLKNEYGLQIGKILTEDLKQGLLSDDLLTRAMRITAAASDARMGGATLAAASNSGSGNQGITATIPVVITAQWIKASHEQLIRALTLSHLTAIYIKSHLPSLSAMCATTTAAMGSAVSITWLLGGDFSASERAVHNIIGDVSGMICDGAKNGCAMKVSTSTQAAIKAVLIAISGSRVTGQEGIIQPNVEDSIRNLGSIVHQGMKTVDTQILKIMTQKMV